MRLPVKGREWFEAGLRATAALLVAILAYRTLFPETVAAPATSVATISDLAPLSRQAAPAHLRFAIDAIPTSTQRAWQDALRSAGSTVSWSGSLKPVVIAARPIASPAGGYTVTGYSSANAAMIFRDDISIIDSVPRQAQARSIMVPIASGRVRAVVDSDSAYTYLSDSVILQRILVIGKAGWETKFVLTALEEAGWKTDAVISVAPAVTVSQGTVATIDTTHYSAVVALDESAASRASAITSFVKSGGGLVIGNAAARSESFAALRVSAPSGAQGNVLIADTITHQSAPFNAISLSSQAVALETRRGSAAVAAKRVDFGRVIQIGFSDTWRWRMQGNAESALEHRGWWSHVLSQVVRTQRANADNRPTDQSPYTGLIDVAGYPVPSVTGSRPLSQRSNETLWLSVVCALLLAEWTSRRLRGAR